MGVINASNQIKFQSSKSLFAQIRSDLESFVALGLIDNRDLYRYVKKIISAFGIGYYMEKQAVLPVSRYKTKLPEDFKLMFSAYRCEGGNYKPGRRALPQTGQVFYLENTCETIEHCKCDIEKVVDKITVRTYIDQQALEQTFSNATLLNITTNTAFEFCDPDSPNIGSKSGNEISIDGEYIHTNFEEGNIYIKYYGFPFDEKGFPMIPDIESVKTAIEDYAKFKLFEKWWSNNSVTDMALVTKMQHYQQAADNALSDASTEAKTPSFQAMVEYKTRDKNRFDVYQFYKL